MSIPSNIVVPVVGISFDDSRANAGPAQMPVNGLLIGQKLSTGTGVKETLLHVTNADYVGQLAGRGSVAHRMAKRWFENNKTTQTYVVLLDDASGATAATAAIAIGGTATAAGEWPLYIAGTRVAIPVQVQDDNDAIGATAVATINALTDLPVTAAYSGGTLTLTCKNAGVAAGDLDVRTAYNAGEATPAGVTIGTASITPGTVDPDINDAIAAIGDTWCNVIAMPYNDTTNLQAVDVYARNQDSAMVQQDGMWYCAKRDTLANLITFGQLVASHNSKYISCLAATARLESTYELAAGKAAAVAASIEDDPSVPLHRMPLIGFKPLAPSDRATLIERNQLALAGIATLKDDVGVQTEACVTMFLVNDAGAASTAYRWENRRFQLMRLRYRFVNRILSRYGRAKLATSADNVRPGGPPIMTLSVAKAEAIAWFMQEEREGQVEGLEQFKEELIVQREGDRIDWLLPPDLMNQFIIGSGVIQFLG